MRRWALSTLRGKDEREHIRERERWGVIQGVVTWSAPDPTLLVPTPGPILLVPTPALPSSFLLQTHTTCKPALTLLFVARYMHAHCPGMVKFHNGLLGGYLRDFVLCKGTMNAHITHRRHTRETHTGDTHRRYTQEAQCIPLVLPPLVSACLPCCYSVVNRSFYRVVPWYVCCTRACEESYGAAFSPLNSAPLYTCTSTYAPLHMHLYAPLYLCTSA